MGRDAATNPEIPSIWAMLNGATLSVPVPHDGFDLIFVGVLVLD
jgi:hypothetical protein